MRWKHTAKAVVAGIVVSASALAQDTRAADAQDYSEGIEQPQTNVDVDVNLAPPTALDPSFQASAEPVAESEDFGKKRSPGKFGMANIRIGGGIEGQLGDLRDELAVGPMWSATVGVQPLPFLGFEGTYSGSTHEVDESIAPAGDGAINGADLMRNGGALSAVVSAPTPFIQPYAVGGVGIDRYTFRESAGGESARNDTAGRVPVGGGLRASAGPIVADLRATYNTLFDDEFVTSRDPGSNDAATYDVGLQIGGQF